MDGAAGRWWSARPPFMASTESGGAFLSGVILAAGASTRLGQPKQLLALGDRPLIQHVIDHVAASCVSEIVLVLGHAAAEIEAVIRVPSSRPVRIVVNSEYAEGQSTSLRCGLRSTDARAAGAAILLGDQPGVADELIDRVAMAFLTADARLARPVFRDAGRRVVPGHPVFLARRIWAEVDHLRGDQGARGIIAAHPEWLLEVPVDGEPPGDVDTWDDYRRLSRDVAPR